ncbi:metal dependent phosphohydrolase [Rhodopirellula maiorica SM1]|uniref:Metal dependent phosphohydrolase n=1 Tax=Rhodopirellula maiorica SM1 TaxID=1265738 RepID=M5S1E4_9BACT|nr:HD-GYP domain-containing protein [Rhodopirellula maiorica]EMI21477.1 metal dependent phosphohydrolase [Rhodopirellula maiorica SM1]
MSEYRAQRLLETRHLQRPQEVAEILQKHFRTPFHLVTSQGSVRLGVTPLAADQVEHTHLSLPDTLQVDALVSAKEPSVHVISADNAILSIPMGNRLKPFALCGIIRERDVNLSIPLAKMIVENVEKQQQIASRDAQLEEYASQVTRDFEELSWLRSLAERPELWHPQNDLKNIASVILPPLCDVLSVEAIFLFVTDTQTGADTLALRVGQTKVRDETMMELVGQFADQTVEQPVVRNSNSLHRGWQDLEGIRSCALVPIASNTQRFGWLVMINKLSPCSDAAVADLSPQLREFGTFEAGLLQSAGLNLAAHASNLESFRQIEDLVVGVIRAMINSIDAKDAYTRGHSDRVAAMGRTLAAKLGLDPQEQHNVYMAGLLHDIGKIGVPDSILGKPSRLSEEEFAIVSRHPEIGCSILKHLKQLDFVLPGVLHHHECFDGSGYPHGLAGQEIPLMGRILAVADAYDAMTSTRPYRNGMPRAKAEAILLAGSGEQWDDQIIDAFMQCADEMYGICQVNRQHPTLLLSDRGSGDAAWDEIDVAVNLSLSK